MPEHNLKRCSKCKEEKTFLEFSPDKTSPSKLASQCRLCRNEGVRLRNLKYKGKYKNKHQESIRLWKEENKEQIRVYNRNWKLNNKERNSLLNKKHAQTPKGNISNRMTCAIWASLREGKRGRSWESLVGYTVDDLKTHLEKLFLVGMSWENKKSWHIDHIIPVSAFNFKTYDDYDFRRCWAMKNLQPLWIKDNLEKSNKINRHFQPSLILGK